MTRTIKTIPNINEYENLNDVKLYVQKAAKIFLICLGLSIVNTILRYTLKNVVDDSSIVFYLLNMIDIILFIGLFKAINIWLVYKYPLYFSLHSWWFSENDIIRQYQKWLISKYTEMEQCYIIRRKSFVDSVFLVLFFLVIFIISLIAYYNGIIETMGLFVISCIFLLTLLFLIVSIKDLVRCNKTMQQ